MKILVVNAGSSSHKFSLFDFQKSLNQDPLWEGMIDWKENQIKVNSIRESFQNMITSTDQKKEIRALIEGIWSGPFQVISDSSEISKIGHRVVHGGGRFDRPVRIDNQVKNEIRRYIPVAPLHNQANLEGIELMETFFPSVPQIAVFDTSYHHTMPEMIKTYPLPYEWKKEGIYRYGFHGISHHYCAERIAQLYQNDHLKIINCHLGNGCSLCAIKEGKSYETTMGFTPLEGLMMGTRSGSIDPGLLIYLLRQKVVNIVELDHMLNFESGLKGIGGHSDMREIIQNRKNPLPKLALDMFIHRLKTSIGALAVSLEGFDVLSFTAGIGENSSYIREETCKGLSFLNIEIDQEKNKICVPDEEISSLSSKIKVVLIHTREDWMIAKSILNF